MRRLPEPAKHDRWATDLVRTLTNVLEDFERNKLSYQRFFAHRSTAAGIEATGSDQGGAAPITADLVEVASGSGGVRLPSARPGMQITVVNVSGGAINVYPAVGGAINALSDDAALSVSDDTVKVFTCIVAGKWYA